MSYLDYTKSVNEKYYLGYCAISFRDQSPNGNSHRTFVLNSKGDGWFRRTSGPGDGYGLCINDLKITSSKPNKMGDFNVYKCVINYINWNEEEARDFFWLYVHKNFELEEILEYIEENKHNWRP